MSAHAMRGAAQAIVAPGPHGICAAMPLPDDLPAALAMLEPEERAITAGMIPRRARAFAAGRCALRAAARELGVDVGAILRGDRGEPLLPPGLAGSVSHDALRAVALVAPAKGSSIGIDVETTLAGPDAVARQVLTAAERLRLRERAGDWADAVLLAFSTKEALQKALAPLLGRLPAFHELEVELRRDGRASVELNLREGGAGLRAEARWWSGGGEVLATARAAHTEEDG